MHTPFIEIAYKNFVQLTVQRERERKKWEEKKSHDGQIFFFRHNFIYVYDELIFGNIDGDRLDLFLCVLYLHVHRLIQHHRCLYFAMYQFHPFLTSLFFSLQSLFFPTHTHTHSHSLICFLWYRSFFISLFFLVYSILLLACLLCTVGFTCLSGANLCAEWTHRVLCCCVYFTKRRKKNSTNFFYNVCLVFMLYFCSKLKLFSEWIW